MRMARRAIVSAAIVSLLPLAAATGPAAADAPPQYVGVFHPPGLADMYPVDVTSTGSSFFVLDAGRYRVVEVDRATGSIVDEFGGHQGRSTTRIGAARAIAHDVAGNIYVADTASNRVVKLDADLDFVTQTGTRGTGDGQFTMDYGIAVGPGLGAGGLDDEVVYVTDGTPGRVQVFTRGLAYLREFGQGIINKPRQLTVDPATQHVFVVSAGPKRVDVFNRNGTFRYSFGSQGSGAAQFTQDPRGVAVMDGYAFVSDPGKDRIQVWDVSSGSQGVHVCNFGSSSTFSDVRGISITDDGVLVAADEWDYSTKEFDVSQIASGCASATLQRRMFGTPPPVGVNSPRGMDVDESGRIFVTDWWNQQIDRLDADGANHTSWGFRGTVNQPGSLNFPWDVAIQPGTGYVFVANRESNEIEVFSPDGAFLGRAGKSGTQPGQFKFPQGLAFGPSGHLYVSDTSNNRVQRCGVSLNVSTKVLTLTCTILAGTGASGTTTFKVPTGIDIAPDGTVWVADTQNGRIQKRNPTTGDWTSFTQPIGGSKFNVPWGVTVGPDGDIWVADSGADRIVRMQPSGSLVYAFTGTQVGAGAFDAPFDVAFVGTRVYIADTWNNRIVVLE